MKLYHFCDSLSIMPRFQRVIEGHIPYHRLVLYEIVIRRLTKKAKHYYCNTCGIHPFSNPGSAPELYSINARCLADHDLETTEYEIVKFDGRSWENAVAKPNEHLCSSDLR